MNDWLKLDCTLCNFEVRDQGAVEDESTKTILVDFANQYIGGGTLGAGRVQVGAVLTPC